MGTNFSGAVREEWYYRAVEVFKLGGRTGS
jgi:hypothetical protein